MHALFLLTQFQQRCACGARCFADDMLWRCFPGHCRFCAQPSNDRLDVCPVCVADLPRDESACLRCARPLAQATADSAAGTTLICGPCIRKPPPVQRTVATLRYATPVDMLIADIKFRGKLASVRILGTLMARTLRDAYAEDAWPELLVPVPLSMRRLLRRGHDQAALLARRLGDQLQIPCALGQVQRIRHTTPQSNLNAALRQRNLIGAFKLRSALPYTHVAIVDDVLTTGATVHELARTLRAAGIARVDVWVAARTPDPPAAASGNG